MLRRECAFTNSGYHSVAKKTQPKPKAPSKPAPKSAKPSKAATKPPAKAAVKAPAKVLGKSAKEATAPKAAKAETKAPATTKAALKAPAKASGKVDAKHEGKHESKVIAKGPAAGAKAAKTAEPVKGDSKESPAKPARKGITIVTPKPVKKVKPKPVVPTTGGASLPRHYSPGGRKPLIPSGPNAVPQQPLGMQGAEPDAPRVELKTPFNKKELERYRAILLRKRSELAGDVHSMESEALTGQSGSLSNLPQHIAEQGSETYEQSLSLDLAAADRKLIKEIDDALGRIANGTYGVCEVTGKPINAERLEELPWARYSIEAARDLERRFMRV